MNRQQKRGGLLYGAGSLTFFAGLKLVGVLDAPWIFVVLLPVALLAVILGVAVLVATGISVFASKFEERLA